MTLDNWADLSLSGWTGTTTATAGAMNFTVAPGSQLLLANAILYNSSASLPAGGGSLQITYNGITMTDTLLGTCISRSGPPSWILYSAYMISPPSGTNNMQLAWTNLSNGPQLIHLHAYSFLSSGTIGIDAGPTATDGVGEATTTLPGTPVATPGTGAMGIQYGFAAFSSSIGGNPDTPTPFATVDANAGKMANNSGIAQMGVYGLAAHGASGFGSNFSWNSNRGSRTFNDAVVAYTLSEVLPSFDLFLTRGQLPVIENLRTVESCSYN